MSTCICSSYANFNKKNGLIAIQYEYDLVNSDWLSLDVTKELRNDQQDSKETTHAITKGDLSYCLVQWFEKHITLYGK